MQKSKYILIRLLILVVCGASIFAFRSSLTPRRNQTQKVYDDFVQQLHKIGNNPVSAGQEPPSDSPHVSITFTVMTNNNKEVLEYNLDWSNPSGKTSSLRILDLLQTANIFSNSSGNLNQTDSVAVTVTSSSGFKFDTSIDSASFMKNPPLPLALAIMRDLTARQAT